MSEGPPIGSDHPTDSEIHLVNIGDGFEPADEARLSSSGIVCESGRQTVAAMNGVTGNAAVWELGNDGAIHAICEIPAMGLKMRVISPSLNVNYEMDLMGDWPHDVTLETCVDTGAPYLYVNFGDPQLRMRLGLDEDLQIAFEHAIDTGVTADAVTAQGKLVEKILFWCNQEWNYGMDYDMICRLERHRLGIREDDIAWEESDLTGYGLDQHAVRVYRAPGDRFLVCYEALSKPIEWGPAEPFALITREQFEAVPHNPYDAHANHRAFLEAADMIRAEWA